MWALGADRGAFGFFRVRLADLGFIGLVSRIGRGDLLGSFLFGFAFLQGQGFDLVAVDPGAVIFPGQARQEQVNSFPIIGLILERGGWLFSPDTHLPLKP